MSKTVFGQEFFGEKIAKNRLDVIGVIIFLRKYSFAPTIFYFV
jgi:hypothetical protein